MREGGRMLAEMLKRLAEEARPGIATKDLEKLARELISSYGVFFRSWRLSGCSLRFGQR